MAKYNDEADEALYRLYSCRHAATDEEKIRFL